MYRLPSTADCIVLAELALSIELISNKFQLPSCIIDITSSPLWLRAASITEHFFQKHEDDRSINLGRNNLQLLCLSIL